MKSATRSYLIGTGGKVIRGIRETSGATFKVDDEGNLVISAAHRGNALIANKMVDEIFAEAEVSKTFKGKVEDVPSMGDEVEVKCLGVDPQGNIKLSRKALLTV